ncbi:hypothetical protein G7Y89_g2663 [Cudoniella acicularis]|uniref:Uncharacterized protein n=1 Tax=Cudoniella acicularis TaxID=354080 RepID=A0A8H4RSV8_9HELO|nr:hypothetical protein G7Y89_g2663 [Cudoniella acicularis]
MTPNHEASGKKTKGLISKKIQESEVKCITGFTNCDECIRRAGAEVGVPQGRERYAPPAKGTQETISLLATSESSPTVEALKETKRAALIAAGRKAHSGAELSQEEWNAIVSRNQHAEQDLQRSFKFWHDIHKKHISSMNTRDPGSSDPKNCPLCDQVRKMINDPEYRSLTQYNDRMIDSHVEKFPRNRELHPGIFNEDDISDDHPASLRQQEELEQNPWEPRPGEQTRDIPNEYSQDGHATADFPQAEEYPKETSESQRWSWGSSEIDWNTPNQPSLEQPSVQDAPTIPPESGTTEQAEYERPPTRRDFHSESTCRNSFQSSESESMPELSVWLQAVNAQQVDTNAAWSEQFLDDLNDNDEEKGAEIHPESGKQQEIKEPSENGECRETENQPGIEEQEEIDEHHASSMGDVNTNDTPEMAVSPTETLPASEEHSETEDGLKRRPSHHITINLHGSSLNESLDVPDALPPPPGFDPNSWESSLTPEPVQAPDDSLSFPNESLEKNEHSMSRTPSFGDFQDVSAPTNVSEDVSSQDTRLSSDSPQGKEIIEKLRKYWTSV